jgi:2,5-diketo-D-gluconate reductase B
MTKVTVSEHGMPMIGLGTFGKQGNVGVDAMLAALDIGYRHIDTAQDYSGNEKDVGEAVVRSRLPREKLHITTKIAHRNLDPAELRTSVKASLDTLQLDYVDLLLIHWPSKDNAVPMSSYLEGLAQCRIDGLAKTIGVSNFTVAQLEQAVGVLGPGALVANQVEVHPFLQNRKVRDAGKRLGLTTVAYMPIAGGAVFGDETILRIAGAHNASPSQISIAWLLHHGVAAIPSSKSSEHLVDNLAAANIKLSSHDVAEIDALDRGQRIINPATISPQWD